jgi:KEOPS complex subunit Cgi121
VRLVEGVASVGAEDPSGETAFADVDTFVDELTTVGAATGTTVQAFDAELVVGREHLERALELADRAFERGENVARDRGVEVLLYAAGRRQIHRALEMGVDEGETPVVVLVAAERGAVSGGEAADREAVDAGSAADREAVDAGSAADREAVDASSAADREADAAEQVRELLAPADTLGPGRADDERVRSLFDVSEAELAAVDGDLSDLVLERVALLDVEK